ncbi:MAG: hypothetical protein DRP33_05650 [Thermotogae bacterium]|nr:MAG: hypothetical protein DRP33_05650 [Thermotogota bacterium]
MGRITQRLSSNRWTPVKVVDRYIPTTQTCYSCGHRQKVELAQREFKCEECRIEINLPYVEYCIVEAGIPLFQ